MTAESDVDALVTSIHPGLGAAPGVTIRDVVLVTGPWLAGTTSLVAALTTAMPGRTFVERDDLSLGEVPVAVVFVASAITPLTASDCALLDAAVANTDAVVCAVSKIDLHNRWRDVLATDRDALATHAPRYAEVPWVGVAAAPDVGDPDVGDLVDALAARLDDPELPRRNRLRQWENRLDEATRRTAGEVAGVGRAARVSALQDERGAALRDGRVARTDRTIALRSRLQQAKVELTYFARNRCTSVRTELVDDAGSMNARRVPAFEEYVAKRSDEVMGEVYDGVTTHLGDMSRELELTPPPGPRPQTPQFTPPVLRSRKLESRLMMLLGAGFGLGVALTVSRLFADLDPRWTIVGLIAGAVVGLAVTVWVVGARGTLQDRAVLERWVGDVTGELLAAAEQHVAARMVIAEAALTAQRAELDEAQAAAVTDRVTVIDAELREHAMATARATAVRNRELPTLRKALAAVREELGEPGPGP